jgi:L-gulonate 5-dehydrogenase
VEKLRAARLIEFNKIAVMEESDPSKPKEWEVLVRIKTAGICGTDIHGYEGSHGAIKPPRIMGHELAGEVEDIGQDVTSVKKGDRVVIDPVLSCGKCFTCRQGRNNICSTVKCIGVAVDGGFCDFIKMPAENVFKFPVSIPWKEAALMEPFSIAAQICERSGIKPGEKAVVVGSGPIGLCVLQAFKRIEAKVLMVDVVDSRLKLANELGADETINSKKESFDKKVYDFTEGEGAQLVVEAVGHPALLEQALKVTAPGARIVVIGFNENPAKIPEVEITKKELEIRGSRLNRHKFPEVIKWFEKREVNPQALISAVYPLEDIDKAFKDIKKDPENICKVVIKY